MYIYLMNIFCNYPAISFKSVVFLICICHLLCKPPSSLGKAIFNVILFFVDVTSTSTLIQICVSVTEPVKIQKKKKSINVLVGFFDSYSVAKLWHSLLISHSNPQRNSSRK